MKILHLPYDEVEQFAATDVAYSQHDKRLLQFAKYAPTLESFSQAIEDKKQDKVDRQLLCEVLKSQYDQYTTNTDRALELIAELNSEKTFTIITAHQPVLFTGPAYVAYKIISAIKLAQTLREKYSNYKFVPIFVTGGEDHDFEEMDHANLYGKNIKWENSESGSVGRMSTNSLAPALQMLEDILGQSPIAKKIFELYQTTHTHHQKYAFAFADLINGLFGQLGIVVANMDDARFKSKMKDIFRDELLYHHSAQYVKDTQSKLESEGFGSQAYAREINLFYLDKGIRNRIEKENGIYRVVDTEMEFSEEEMLALVENKPEVFSPNVVIRPLYQERIFPNLAYVGGGGELAYWLERKSQFDFFGINFPVLIRRDSCLWIDKGNLKKMQKLNLPVDDFFKSEVQQIKDFVRNNAEHEFSLQEENHKLEEIWLEIEKKAETIDPTLKGAAAAEGRNQIKALEKMEDRLRRAEKQKHDIALGQIKGIREKLYPGGGLQERVVNFLEFYLKNPESYFTILMDSFDPLNMQLLILVDE